MSYRAALLIPPLAASPLTASVGMPQPCHLPKRSALGRGEEFKAGRGSAQGGEQVDIWSVSVGRTQAVQFASGTVRVAVFQAGAAVARRSR